MITVSDFLSTLRPSNVGYPGLAAYLTTQDVQGLCLYMKGDDLCEVVEDCLQRRMYPIVHKSRRLVAAIPRKHHMLRAAFLRYERNNLFAGVPTEVCADNYTLDGFGYHFSSRGNRVIVGFRYQPDSNDQMLFDIYRGRIWTLVPPSQR